MARGGRVGEPSATRMVTRVRPQQVRVAWAKDADQFTHHGRTLPDPAADHYDMVDDLVAVGSLIAARFPSVQAVS